MSCNDFMMTHTSPGTGAVSSMRVFTSSVPMAEPQLLRPWKGQVWYLSHSASNSFLILTLQWSNRWRTKNSQLAFACVFPLKLFVVPCVAPEKCRSDAVLFLFLLSNASNNGWLVVLSSGSRCLALLRLAYVWIIILSRYFSHDGKHSVCKHYRWYRELLGALYRIRRSEIYIELHCKLNLSTSACPCWSTSSTSYPHVKSTLSRQRSTVGSTTSPALKRVKNHTAQLTGQFEHKCAVKLILSGLVEGSRQRDSWKNSFENTSSMTWSSALWFTKWSFGTRCFASHWVSFSLVEAKLTRLWNEV